MMSDKNITIDDVLEFIRKHGAVYDYRIYEELKKLPNPKITPEEATAQRPELYKRLAKL